jgi:hypothetical protein
MLKFGVLQVSLRTLFMLQAKLVSAEVLQLRLLWLAA